jgi:type VI secretion system protein ImpK
MPAVTLPAPPSSGPAAPRVQPPSQFDLMYEGFYALHLIRTGAGIGDSKAFRKKTLAFLEDFTRQARDHGHDSDTIETSKRAFCATLDELVFRHIPALREDWEIHPIQLELFGDQLSGDHFFQRLEELRLRGASQLATLEVFHMCLLMGFQGRYVLEGQERLRFLTARLGDEIALLKGGRAAFAPYAGRPDHVAHPLRRRASGWVVAAVLAGFALIGYVGLYLMLTQATDAKMKEAETLMQPNANVTITLP